MHSDLILRTTDEAARQTITQRATEHDLNFDSRNTNDGSVRPYSVKVFGEHEPFDLAVLYDGLDVEVIHTLTVEH